MIAETVDFDWIFGWIENWRLLNGYVFANGDD